MFLGIAYAKPYTPQAIDSLIRQEQGYQFHLGKAIEMAEKIGEFAAEYPTKFDNEADKKQAAQDASVLAGML